MITYRSSGNHMIMSPQYYRMGFFGGDISKPLGQFVLRGEAAFNVDKHFSYKPEAGAMEQKGFNTVNYLVGVDWYAPHEWMVMAQFSSESILRYENQIAQPRHQSLLTLNVSKTVGQYITIIQFHLFRPQPRGMVQPLHLLLCAE